MTLRPTSSLTEALNWYLENLDVTAIDRPWIATSDQHRGDGSGIDDFAKNEELYVATMRPYAKAGCIHIEVGDKEDQWKFSCFLADFFNAHPEAYTVDGEFIDRKRVKGNHDCVQSYPEALLLSWKGRKILVVHKHEGDTMNDEHWEWARFLVRTFWRPLQSIGIEDPTTPDISEITARPENPTKHLAIMAEAKAWCKAHPDIVLLSGHDHFGHLDGNDADCGAWCADQVGGQAIVGDEDGNIEVKYFAKPQERG